MNTKAVAFPAIVCLIKDKTQEQQPGTSVTGLTHRLRFGLLF